jgi:uncharacterized SAM-binding protein YcdF (DUF218 family)
VGRVISVYERLGEWLVSQGPLAPPDALVVLDGAEFELRLAAGVDLLRRGFAPRLVVVQSRYHEALHGGARAAASARPGQIFLLPCKAASTAQEAAEVCPLLEAWGCASVMVVTSWYHTRRARAVFARRLKGRSVRVAAYPVAVPGAGRGSWWRSQLGRKTIGLEFVKVVAMWLRLDLPGARDMRFRIKEWLLPTTASAEPEEQKPDERKAA